MTVYKKIVINKPICKVQKEVTTTFDFLSIFFLSESDELEHKR